MADPEPDPPVHDQRAAGVCGLARHQLAQGARAGQYLVAARLLFDDDVRTGQRLGGTSGGGAALDAAPGEEGPAGKVLFRDQERNGPRVRRTTHPPAGSSRLHEPGVRTHRSPVAGDRFHRGLTEDPTTPAEAVR